ncbi:MAG: site-specific DNA-methyltransferase [Lachnospiraceae bacterium]
MSNENKVKNIDAPVHDWYRFVLSFPPHLVQEYIEKFGIEHGNIVLDPFCGTGTTNVECKKRGIVSIGIEANPITCFASSTKCNWEADTFLMYQEAEQIAYQAACLIDHCVELRYLTEEQNKLILKNSISEKPLSQALILRDAILAAHSRYEGYFLLALAKNIVYSYSNLKFGPEVGISRKKIYDVDVVPLWLHQILIMQKDIRQYSFQNDVSSFIINGDARSISSLPIRKKVDFIITSPPYPNEKDYSRTTRLESVLLGFINSKEQLRSVKKQFIRSNTKNVYKTDNDSQYVANISSITALSQSIEERRIALNKTSGFEKLYSSVVKLYFGGMAKHFQELKSVLAKNARLAYVVGDQASYFKIPIRTAELLAEVAENEGYEVEGIEPFRKRYATGTDTWLNENVLILKYVGE